MAGDTLVYSDGETQFAGYMMAAREEGARAGVIVFHGGSGLDAHARLQAERYAELGYAVLAADLYGKGALTSREAVMATIGALQADRDLLVHRADASLAALRSSLDPAAPVAVVGFCFGGMAALQYARSGAHLAATISIHGSLTTNRSAKPGAVKSRLLVCHGAADPHVPMEQVTAFASEMESAGADWEIVVYGGAQHGFTHRDAVGDRAKNGVAYNERVDRLSFARAADFLKEALG